MQKSDVERNLKHFAEQHNCDALILMGMHVSNDGSVQRDLGIISIKLPALAEQISNGLVSNEQLSMELVPIDSEIGILATLGKFYKQLNIRASRKQILPIVQNILDKYE